MRVCPIVSDLQSRRGGEAYKAQRVRRRWSWRQEQRRFVCLLGYLDFAVTPGRGSLQSATCTAVLAVMWVQRRFACLPGYFDFAVALG